MQRNAHANGVVTYTFDSLEQHAIQAHVSTRHGGVSPAPWNTLNFSVLRGDSRERVTENRRHFAAAVGIDPAHVTHARQVHGTGVAKVSWDDVGETLDGCDALITAAQSSLVRVRGHLQPSRAARSKMTMGRAPS